MCVCARARVFYCEIHVVKYRWKKNLFSSYVIYQERKKIFSINFKRYWYKECSKFMTFSRMFAMNFWDKIIINDNFKAKISMIFILLKHFSQ